LRSYGLVCAGQRIILGKGGKPPGCESTQKILGVCALRCKEIAGIRKE
jgi:hypothetical protein